MSFAERFGSSLTVVLGIVWLALFYGVLAYIGLYVIGYAIGRGFTTARFHVEKLFADRAKEEQL